MSSGLRREDLAVLYRMNRQAAVVEQARASAGSGGV